MSPSALLAASRQAGEAAGCATADVEDGIAGAGVAASSLPTPTRPLARSPASQPVSQLVMVKATMTSIRTPVVRRRTGSADAPRLTR